MWWFAFDIESCLLWLHDFICYLFDILFDYHIQEYYSQVANPIDLSKVMLKFHGGVYHSLDAFSRDMRQMFNNYKMFFKEANTEVWS